MYLKVRRTLFLDEHETLDETNDTLDKVIIPLDDTLDELFDKNYVILYLQPILKLKKIF